MEERLRNLFRDFNPDPKPHEPVTTDSLEHVQLIMMMEEEFGFEITDEEENRLHTFTDFVKLAESKA